MPATCGMASLHLWSGGPWRKSPQVRESVLIVLIVLRKQARRSEEGHVASAVMVAIVSFAVGLLNAASISH
jgi:hypothetical protein